MRRKNIFLFVLVLVLGFSVQAHSTLYNRGTDSLGNQLIYDSDLDITWYDYSMAKDGWSYQVDWASALTVEFNRAVYDDWRLPITIQPDSSCSDQNSYGYNCTGSEMGHLYYIGLSNSAGGSLTKQGDFQHLQSGSYWTGTEYAIDPGSAWRFITSDGAQYLGLKDSFRFISYAIAVRDGDVAVAPEPISSILFSIGGATLMGRNYFRRKKD